MIPERSCAFWRCLLLTLTLTLLLAGAALAQNVVSGCPSGNITAGATYNLTMDCAQTGTIQLQTSGQNPGSYTVTINGGGHRMTFDGFRGFNVWGRGSHGRVTLVLNNVTLDGSNNYSNTDPIIELVDNSTLVMSDTTVTRSYSTAPVYVHVSTSPQGSTPAATFTRVLFVGNTTISSRRVGNLASAVTVANGSVTFNNVVFRWNSYGPAVVTVREGGAATFSGCLSFQGNYPEHIINTGGGTVSGLSGRPTCSGTIGNKGSPVLSPASRAACGMPAGGFVDASHTWTLVSDCTLTRSLRIRPGRTVTIEGNGHSIRSSADSAVDPVLLISRRTTLNLNNVGLDRVRLYNYGQVNARRMAVRNSTTWALYNLNQMRLDNVLLENNSVDNANFGSALVSADWYGGGGEVQINNAIIRNNQGGSAALSSETGMTMTLTGCLTLAGNTNQGGVAADFDAAGLAAGRIINNNNGSACDPAIIGPFTPPDPPAPTPETRASGAGVRINSDKAASVVLFASNGAYEVYFILDDSEGVHFQTLPTVDSLLASGQAGGELLRTTHPASGKPVVVTWLPKTRQIEISTFYADEPPYQVDKPYIFRINRDGSVTIVAW